MKFDTPPLWSLLLIAAITSFGGFSVARAQTPADPGDKPDKIAIDRANELIVKADYAGAISAYEAITRDFPNSIFIPEAVERSGYAHFLLGQFDKSVEALNKVPGLKDAQPDQIESSLALAATVLTAKAAKLPATDPDRTRAFEEAAKQADVFLQKFPNSEEAESTLYYKGLALFQISKYDEAIATFRLGLKNFATSPTILDTQYLLALTLATVASNESQKSGKEAAVDKNYDEAEKLLNDIITKKTDVALLNDSRFQIGELLLARSGTASADKRIAYLERALEYYRLVVSRDIVVQAQKYRVDQFVQFQTAAAGKGDIAGARRYLHIADRERQKISALADRADLTPISKMKIGQIYFQLEKFDEARIVFKYTQDLPGIDADMKKQIAYFTVLAYALETFDLKRSLSVAAATEANEKLSLKAEEAYKQFKTTYPKDPIADNLPLLVGRRFIDSDPEKALVYLKECVDDYPNGRFKIQAQAEQANALSGKKLERYDEALDIYKKTLEGNPSKEIAAPAEYGIAIIHKTTGKTEEAIKEFQAVRDKYPGTTQAEQASYFTGQMLYEKGEMAAAIPELEGYLKRHPNTDLASNALYFLAKAKQATGKTDEAIALYKDLAVKYPKSEVAPFSYFERVKIAGANKDDDGAGGIEVMREFIKTFPDNDRIFDAYDFIAKTLASHGKRDEAIAVYQEYITAHPQDANAPRAMMQTSGIWKDVAAKIRPFSMAREDEKTEKAAAYRNSVAAAERVLNEYPESASVSLALQDILDGEQELIKGKVITESDVESYLKGLAEKFEKIPSTKNKIMFALAAFTAQKDPKKSGSIMEGIFDPQLKYAPDDIDLYATSLVNSKKLDEAMKVYLKLADDYPVTKGMDPKKAPRETQEAQAISLFGQGKVLQEKAAEATSADKEVKLKEAQAKFDELKALYPWSPKVTEANYGIALSKFEQKQYPEALTLLLTVARADRAPAELRAKGLTMIAQINEAQGDYDNAVANYIKVESMFGNGVPSMSAESLWRAGQILERQARGEIAMATPAPKPSAKAAAKKEPAAAPAKKEPASKTAAKKEPAAAAAKK